MKHIISEIKSFQKQGKKIQVDCGYGIKMIFIQFPEQDFKTFIQRLNNLNNKNETNT